MLRWSLGGLTVLEQRSHTVSFYFVCKIEDLTVKLHFVQALQHTMIGCRNDTSKNDTSEENAKSV